MKNKGIVDKGGPRPIHGFAVRNKKRPSEYTTWDHMKRRCHDPKHVRYGAYGGRGITVCDRWRNSFVDFISDMGYKPSPSHTLDRIDGNGNYEPGNVRWSTPIEQSRNTKKNRNITVGGQTMCVSAWAEKLGTSKSTITGRLNNGWDEADAVTKPVNSQYKNTGNQNT